MSDVRFEFLRVEGITMYRLAKKVNTGKWIEGIKIFMYDGRTERNISLSDKPCWSFPPVVMYIFLLNS